MHCEAAAIITSHRAEIELEKIICMKSAPKPALNPQSLSSRVSLSNTHGGDAVNENTLGGGGGKKVLNKPNQFSYLCHHYFSGSPEPLTAHSLPRTFLNIPPSVCGHAQQRAGQDWLKSLIYPAPKAGLVQQGQAALGLSCSPLRAAEAKQGLHRLSHCSRKSGEQGQKAP